MNLHKKSLLAAVLLAIVSIPIIALYSTSATARPDHVIDVNYYSDSGQQVGSFFWGCYGSPQFTGQVTNNVQAGPLNGRDCNPGPWGDFPW